MALPLSRSCTRLSAAAGAVELDGVAFEQVLHALERRRRPVGRCAAVRIRQLLSQQRRLRAQHLQRVARKDRAEVDSALRAAALPRHDKLLVRYAARDEPLLAGEGAVAGELVLDGLGRVELEVRRQTRPRTP